MKILAKTRITYLSTIIAGILSIFLAIAIVTFPGDAFRASLQGLKIWWEIIFPALLPFFITAEILLGFGVVHFIGILLEPLMKPLFKVPGVGAFVLAMGFASGYPMGAKLTTRLREQGLISQIEGERLVAFTTTSDPLFLFGAIAVGFFHDAKLGLIIAFIHYTSSLIVGFTMRFYKRDSRDFAGTDKDYQKQNILLKAFKAMHEARLNDGRKFGKLMGDAVMTSINTLLMIGGFIIFFSVILSLITNLNLTLLFTKTIALILAALGISKEFSQAVIYGIFEVTLGAKAISELSGSLPLIQKIAVVSLISAWSGISVHAQVAAILQKTDIRYFPFLIARIFHSIIAFFLTLILWKPLRLEEISTSLPALKYNFLSHSVAYNFWNTMYLSLIAIFLLFVLLIVAFLFYLIKRINYINFD